MHRSSIAFYAYALSVLVAACDPAAAQTLYGITHNADLMTINTATGAGTLVGTATGLSLITGLDFRAGKLYILSRTTSLLYQIDPATGQRIGAPINIALGPTPIEGDMVFRPSDGIGFISAASPPSKLISFDITAPSSSVVGALPVDIDGLAFDGSGTLFGMEQTGSKLFTIDPVTAARTLVGSPALGGTGMGVGGLAFDAGGNLYAAVSYGGIFGPSKLFKLDPVTGTPTMIGPIGMNGVSGLRFGVPAPPLSGVIVAESGGSTDVAEGGATDTYTIQLNTAPTANVTITISPDTQVKTSTLALTFTPLNWAAPQTVTVTAVDDAVIEGLHTGTILHSAASADAKYNGIAVASVTANITDNDFPPPGGGGGVGEGSYGGSQGPGGGEGGDGFGGRSVRKPAAQLGRKPATLLDPTLVRGETWTVRNVANRGATQPSIQPNDALALAAFGGMALSVLACWIASRRPRSGG